MSLLRRTRALLVIAGSWGLAWGALGAALSVRALVGHGGGELAWSLLQVGVVKGALSGAVFALLLAGLERRQQVARLSSGRLAVWGALAGVLWMLVLMAGAGLLEPGWRPSAAAGITLFNQGMLAMCSALVTLWLARRGGGRAAGTGTDGGLASGVPPMGELSAGPSAPEPRREGRIREAVT